MACTAHPWGLDDGLPCVGEDTPHAHVYKASAVGDRHDESEAAAERGRA